MYLKLSLGLCACEQNALPTIPGLDVGGELRYPHVTHFHTWGTNLCTTPPSYFLQIHCMCYTCSACVTGRYRCHFSGLEQSQLSTNPLGKASMANSSPFCQHLPQVCKVEHTIDKCIRDSIMKSSKGAKMGNQQGKGNYLLVGY